MPVTGQYYYLMEAFSGAIEFGSPYMVMDNLKKGLEEKNDSLINKSLEQLKEVFADIHNKDYDHEVDRKVAKAIFPVYAEIIPAEQRPAFYQDIEKSLKATIMLILMPCMTIPSWQTRPTLTSSSRNLQ